MRQRLGERLIRHFLFLSQLRRGWNGWWGTKAPGPLFQDILGKMGVNSTLLGVFVPRKSRSPRGSTSHPGLQLAQRSLLCCTSGQNDEFWGCLPQALTSEWGKKNPLEGAMKALGLIQFRKELQGADLGGKAAA